MEKKKEMFTIWNWIILVASGLLGILFLVDAVLANIYSLFWFLLFLIGFVSMIGKYKRIKRNNHA